MAAGRTCACCGDADEAVKEWMQCVQRADGSVFPADVYRSYVCRPCWGRRHFPDDEEGLIAAIRITRSMAALAAQQPAGPPRCKHCGDYNPYQSGPFTCFQCRQDPWR